VNYCHNDEGHNKNSGILVNTMKTKTKIKTRIKTIAKVHEL